MTYVILEAGATHQGFESCKRIIDACAEAGANAIKFQSIFADDLLSDNSLSVRYTNYAGEEKDTSMYAALKSRELSWEQWEKLCNYAHERTLDFISTPSSFEGFKILFEIGADIKITKGDQNHRYLIRQIVDYLSQNARKETPVVYLDGREAIGEVAWAFDLLHAIQVPVNIIHCPSGYPAPVAGTHLSAIPVLVQAFPNAIIGYADHSVGTALCFAAMGLGAGIIEKTVTERNDFDAPEHSMSLEIGWEVNDFTKAVRDVDEAYGDPGVIFSSRVNPIVRRGIYAARDIRPGEQIGLNNLTFLRPEGLIPADRYEEVVGERARIDIQKGQRIDHYVVS
jgi:N,N'-diacetyllegionaminate synthase